MPQPILILGELLACESLFLSNHYYFVIRKFVPHHKRIKKYAVPPPSWDVAKKTLTSAGKCCHFPHSLSQQFCTENIITLGCRRRSESSEIYSAHELRFKPSSKDGTFSPYHHLMPSQELGKYWLMENTVYAPCT